MILLCLLMLSPLEWKLDRQWPLSRYGITNADAFAVSDDGIIAVIDRDEKQIVFVDVQGNMIQRSGRGGQGPGEFGYTPEIQWNKRDGVFSVYDEIANKISAWDEHGNLVKEYRVPRHRWMENLLYPTSPGEIVFSKFIMGYDKQEPTLVRYNIAQNAEATLWRHRMEKPRTGTADTTMGHFGMVNDFHSRLLYGLGSNFIAVTFSDQDRIHIIDLKGKPTDTTFSPDLPSWPITHERIEAWLSNHEPFVRRMVRKENLHLPEFYPAVSKVMVDDEDRIWIFGFPKGIHGDTPFKIFTRKGDVVAEGELSKPAHVISNGHIYYLTESDEDLILERLRFVFSP